MKKTDWSLELNYRFDNPRAAYAADMPVKAAAALAKATLIVDDITPTLLYRSVDVCAIRAGFFSPDAMGGS